MIGHQKEAMARKLRLHKRRQAADSQAQKVLQGMSDVAHDKKKIEDQLEVTLFFEKSLAKLCLIFHS